MYVSRDVTVQEGDANQVTVVSREPGVAGERGQLAVTGASAESVAVRVLTSRPVLSGGSIRHLLALRPVLEGAAETV